MQKKTSKPDFFLPLKCLVSNFSVISIDQMITWVVFQIILYYYNRSSSNCGEKALLLCPSHAGFCSLHHLLAICWASCWHYFSPFYKGVLTTAFVVCILNAQQRGSPFGRVVFWNKPSATALLSVHSPRKGDRHKQSRFIYCMALHKEFILFLVLTLAHKNAFVLGFFPHLN